MMNICQRIKQIFTSQKSKMHFSLYIDPSLISDVAQRADLVSRIEGSFSGHRQSNPIPNYYIIMVPNQDTYRSIILRITEVCRGTGVRFMASPVMESGRYNGWIGNNIWAEINAISS
ncbi:MAG TPA: hypothetical protein VNY73_00625 [Bacteroidia bacterium]|jgi:hypothetical protein|nr:hypothetical protein [Bacteroidia bacterium]